MVRLWNWALLTGLIASVHGVAVDDQEAPLLQPIGIDFSPEIITVAYANSSDNVTILAINMPSDGDLYYRHLFQLRLESLDRASEAHREENPHRAAWVIHDLQQQVLSLLSRVKPLEGGAGDDTWAWSCIRRVWNAIADVSLRISALIPQRSLGPITFDEIKNNFHDVFTKLKDQIKEEHSIDIQSCILTVPEFFNLTLAELVTDAAREVGIFPHHGATQRTVMSVWSGSDGVKSGTDNLYLVIDFGEFYLDLRTVHSNPEKVSHDRYSSLDAWGSAAINQELANRVIRGSEVLPSWLSSGGHKVILHHAVKRARFFIRNDLDTEFLGEGGVEDNHHDEYPIDLIWPGPDHQEQVGAVLSWADVQAEEGKYVDSLAANMQTHLILVKSLEDGTGVENTVLPMIDKVFILTSGGDGQLIKRAVQRVIGDNVEIVGGTMREFYLAAEGAARGALLVRENQEKKQWLNRQRDEL